MICQEFSHISVRVKLTAYRGSSALLRESISLMFVDDPCLRVIRALKIENMPKFPARIGP